MSLWTEHPLPWTLQKSAGCWLLGDANKEAIDTLELDCDQWQEIIDRLNAGEKLADAAKRLVEFADGDRDMSNLREVRAALAAYESHRP